MGKFCHLHVHSQYSLLDGAIRLEDLFKAAKAYEMDAVAITDHGNIFGAVEFFEHAYKEGVKPILGCEVYVAPKSMAIKAPDPTEPPSYHLVLLVMDEVGYKNLCRLITTSYKEGFYYNPRVDIQLLRELNQGLIAMSACFKGRIPSLILKDQMKEAQRAAEELASIFDKERFFLEVMANRLLEQEKINRALKEIGQKLGLPLVATNDCHYLRREDAEAHDVLLCIQTGSKVEDKDRLRFSTDDFYFKSEEQMRRELPDFEEAISNTELVQKRCNYTMKFGEYKYPAFPIEKGESLDGILDRRAREGLKRRLQERGDESIDLRIYTERLNYELDVIRSMGFSGYFLIVSDFIQYAKAEKIPVGPGRGSAAGSLVAYALGITDVDPIKYGLIFERFLNPGRISMPDIDIDFCKNGRDKVIRYVTEKYGNDCVSQIITFGTMKARAVIRDVARCLGIENKIADRIAKLVPPRPNITLDEAMEEEPELKRLSEGGDPRIQKLISISKALEGLSRHPSTHASGVVISDRPLVEYLPLYIDQKGEVMTHFTMEALEKIGLIKFDFLGVKTLTVIAKTRELIAKNKGFWLDMDSLDLSDEATYELCSDGKTTGVFQLESAGMKRLLRRLRPKRFEDLIAILALYRPGPLGSNMVNDFIEGKNGRKEIDYIFPELKAVLEETYGVLLYQEQAMKIAQIVADYSMAEADELRKAIGKKKEDIMEKQRQRFIEGAIKKGKPKEKVEYLFELISKFGGYGFNKSHSTAYAMVAFQTAFLKAHFPLEFMTALLSLDMDNRDKTIKNILECKSMGIEVLGPDINKSNADFTIFISERDHTPGIRFGLAAVKNVGSSAVGAIVRERDQRGPFKDLGDFVKRMFGQKITKRVTQCLIEAGAFDFTGKSRPYLLSLLDALLQPKPAQRGVQRPTLFQGLKSGAKPEEDPFIPNIKPQEWSKEELLKREKEAIGFYITGHPLDDYQGLTKMISSVSLQDLLSLEEDERVEHQVCLAVITGLKFKKTKKGEKMALLQVEDMTGSVECLLFPDTLKNIGSSVVTERPVVLNITAENTGEGIRATINEIVEVEDYISSKARALVIVVQEENVTGEMIAQLERLIQIHSGDKALFFHIGNGAQKTLLKAGEEFRVKLSLGSLRDFQSVPGVEYLRLLR